MTVVNPMRIFIGIVLFSAFAMAANAHAATLTTLHSFCARSGCADGFQPIGGLVSDGAGNLYGITAFGGRYGVGTIGGTGGVVFRLSPDGAGGYLFKVLHNFCAKSGCPDGQIPQGGLIIGTDGNLFGTTSSGGKNNQGTVFEMSAPSAGRQIWHYRVLHNFCSRGGTNCSDGAQPTGRLTYAGAASGALYDGNSPLYGTAETGGNNGGVVYAMTPSGSAWTQSVVYAFCPGGNCSTGSVPTNSLLMDAAGHLFGVTRFGGTNGPEGTAFSLSFVAGTGWSLQTLQRFCTLPRCADGGYPTSGLSIDATRNLYGVSANGGANDKGTLYKLTPNGSGGYVYSILHDFCSDTLCADGSEPAGDVIVKADGSLVGSASKKGPSGRPFAGALFRYTPDGTYDAFYGFCQITHCRDGGLPEGDLLLDPSGNIFGVSLGGGEHDIDNGGGGTAYEVTP